MKIIETILNKKEIFKKPIILIFIVFIILGILFTTTYESKEKKKLRIERETRIIKYDEFRQKEIEYANKERSRLEECMNKNLHNLGKDIKGINCKDFIAPSFIQKVSADNIIEKNRDTIIMERVCKYSLTSPICNNWELYNKLKKITNDIGINDMGVPLGIKYAESHIGVNFARTVNGKIIGDNGICKAYNNWGGIKQKVNSNGKVITSFKYPDNNGCRLAKFDTIEEYWTNYITIIKKNYIDKGCVYPNMVSCISKNYVGQPGVVEQDWVNRVIMIAE